VEEHKGGNHQYEYAQTNDDLGDWSNTSLGGFLFWD
jgi:hypothetical protein